MAATPSIEILTRGGDYYETTRTWANRHHFSGGTPADTTHWQTLANAVVAAQKATVDSAETIVGVNGYAAGSDVPVYTETISVAGTLSVASGVKLPLQCNGLIRWSTDQRTSKNHPIYLFSYMRPCYFISGAHADVLAATYTTALGTYADAWITGFSDGANTYHRAGPNGAVGTGRYIFPYVRTHRFPS